MIWIGDGRFTVFSMTHTHFKTTWRLVKIGSAPLERHVLFSKGTDIFPPQFSPFIKRLCGAKMTVAQAGTPVTPGLANSQEPGCEESLYQRRRDEQGTGQPQHFSAPQQAAGHVGAIFL